MVTIAVWMIEDKITGFFVINTESTFSTPYPLSVYGRYTCRLTLSSGEVVSDSFVYEEPSLSPSPSPPPPPSLSPSVTVSVQLSSENAHCIVQGDLSMVTIAVWMIEDKIVGYFVINTESTVFFTPYPLSVYGRHTCRLTLSSGEVVSDTFVYEGPSSSPSPSPSLSPSPTPDKRIVSIVLLGSSDITCTVSLSESDIADISIFYNGQDLHGRVMYGTTTTVISAVGSSPGNYVCVVTTNDGRIEQALLEISNPTLPPSTVSPPTSLEAEWVDGADGSLGNILVSWEEPVSSEGLRGYKINWGQPGL